MAATSSVPSSLDQIPTLDLLDELTRRYACLSKPEKRLVFLGAPGSGKGTQSNQLEKEYCLCHISTGDLLRDAVREQTRFGKMAKESMDRGEMVSDEIVVPILEQRMSSSDCRRGFILDGFPRNMTQAATLDRLLSREGQKLDGVIYFDVPDDVLQKRVCGRRVHMPSGRLYHVDFKPPKLPGKDDLTGDSLIHRKDDNEETLRRRLTSFRNETMPLVDHYSKMGMLYRLDARKSSTDVRKDLMQVVDRTNANAERS